MLIVVAYGKTIVGRTDFERLANPARGKGCVRHVVAREKMVAALALTSEFREKHGRTGRLFELCGRGSGGACKWTVRSLKPNEAAKAGEIVISSSADAFAFVRRFRRVLRDAVRLEGTLFS